MYYMKCALRSVLAGNTRILIAYRINKFPLQFLIKLIQKEESYDNELDIQLYHPKRLYMMYQHTIFMINHTRVSIMYFFVYF